MLDMMRGEHKSLLRALVIGALLAALTVGGVGMVSAAGVEAQGGASLEEILDGLENGTISLDVIGGLNDILRIAIATDKGVKQAGYQLDGAMGHLEQISAILKPQIQGGVSHSVSGLEHLELETTSGRLTWAQQLLPNNDLRAGLETAKLGAQQAAIAQQEAVTRVVANVQSAYYGLVKSLRGVRLAELAVSNGAAKVQVAQDKLEAGIATPLDVLTAQNELLEAQNALNATRSGANLALLGLLQIIGLDHTYLDRADQWAENLIGDQDLTPVPWEVDFEQALDFALSNRLDLKSAEKQVQMAEVGVRAVERRRDWKVSLSGLRQVEDFVVQGSVDSDWMATGTAARSKGDASSLPTGGPTPDWQVGLELSYTFGDGGTREAELKQADSQYRSAQLQYDGLADSLSLMIYGAMEKMTQAWAAYELAESALVQAETTYRQTRQMVELGSLPQTDLLDIELMVRQGENQLLSAGLDYELAKTELAVAMGIPTDRLVQAVGQRDWEFAVSGS